MNKYNELFLTTTDTVTGLGAPVSKKNKNNIIDLKNRPKDKPLIIMIGNIEQARKYKAWSPEAEKLAAEVWPGQTTLVISNNLALRIPDLPELQALLEQLGPCYMTSANFAGENPGTLAEAKELFHEVGSYYDFGKGSGKPSKIIDVRTNEVLR